MLKLVVAAVVDFAVAEVEKWMELVDQERFLPFYSTLDLEGKHSGLCSPQRT